MAGNSPEYMPWDTNLNRDVNLCVNRHCLFSSHLENGDPNKFTIDTPARGARAYKRVLTGCPSSGRILQDIKAVYHAIMEVYKAKGAIVPGLGDCRGKRGQSAAIALNANGDRKERRGGARVPATEMNPSSGCWLM
jgi:hypothetical protein